MSMWFIGGGAMAEAMIKGILEARVLSPDKIGVSELIEDRRVYLDERYGIEVMDGYQGLSSVQTVVLAIKPQSAKVVMSEVSSFINPQQTVISIMGGVNIETLVASLDHKAVIRVMPNTPAQIGSGVSVWTATPQVTNSALEEAREIIGSFGEEIYVDDEKMIDMATALSGCGPGYVFLFIEALIDAGVNIGLSRDLSRTLVLQTVLGSAKLVRESGSHPAQLKDLVTSPAGATIAGVLALEQAGFRGTVINAVNLAYRKTKLLGD